MTELPDLSLIPVAQKDELTRFLFAEVTRLSAQVTALLAEVAELKARINKNSQNSSKPPSSDGLAKKKKTRSLRGKSNKKQGGQIGHKGTTLKLSENPTKVIRHPLPTHCHRCGDALPPDDAQVSERRQVIEAPVTPCEVIEHHALAQHCQCGQWHTSAFPATVTETVQYGPNLRALGVHLNQGQLLPFARASRLIQDLYRISVSPGTLVSWVSEARAALQGTADCIADHLRKAPVINADESGLRVAGKLYWLHIAASDTLTWYGVHAKRGMEAIEAHGILPNHRGVLVHDCWAPYWKLDAGTHALCNAHLLRELVYVEEITGQEWPQLMINFLLNANRLCDAARQKQVDFSIADVAAFGTLYDAIVREGEQLHPELTRPAGKRGRRKQSIAFNLLRRFRQHADAVLLFISNHAVPFTNNVGERAVRMPKSKQKVSGCFRTITGAENFCVIRSCLDTLRKQGHGMLDVLRQAFAGNPVRPTA